MKFLLDMNLSEELGRLLEREGHGWRHLRAVGLQSADDAEVVEVAKRNDEVILTHDLDFGRLLAFSGARRPSTVIFRRRDVRTESLFEALHSHWEAVAPALEKGGLVILEEEAVRIRRLPIE